MDATQAKKKLAPAGGMLNLNSRDPFADAETGGPSGAGTPIHEEPRGSDKIHIRIQQRNGRKMLTTVQGLGKEYDAKKVLKAFKKVTARPGPLKKPHPDRPLFATFGIPAD